MATVVEDFEDTTYAVTMSGTWARTNTTSSAGSWSLKSGTIGDSGTSNMVITVPAGATAVQFSYRISSESGYDFFRVLVGTTEVLSGSGEVSWTLSSNYAIPAGVTEITFRYTKDGSQVAGADAAYIDNLTFTVGPVNKANNFNGGTNGTTISTANSGGTSGDAITNVLGSPQYTNAAFAGPSGLSAVNPSSGVDTHLDWLNVTQPGNTFCVRFYMRLAANVTSIQRIFVLIGATSIVSAVWVSPTGLIALYAGYSATLAGQFTGAVPVGQWIRVELRYTIDGSGNGTAEMWRYANANATAHSEYVSSSTLAWPGGKPKDAEFHLQRDAGYWYLDSIAISDTKIGSAYPQLTATTGQAVETDSARPIRPVKARLIGQAVEADQARPTRSVRARLLGQAVETDSARPVSRRKTRLVGQAVEADSALPLRSVRARLLGQAVEANQAMPITASTGPVLQTAVETDLAMPITARKRRLVGQAVEADQAQAIRPALARLLGQAVEADQARPVSRRKTHLVGQAVELDLALPIRHKVLQTAVETDLALPITAILYRPTPLHVGRPRTAWRASSPRVPWSAGEPRASWRASSPRT